MFRDWRGGHLIAEVHQYLGIVSVPILEMHAIRFGLQLALQQGFQ